ncbi:MAG: DNA polymerase III subunit delta' C-terminal domain-containing protein [Ignavibacteria bacterium]|jgi:DNA polymerase-3 subunit delta'
MIDFFDNIEGQHRAKQILFKFNSDSKIPHALLFSGIDGIGKEKTAIRFAQYLNSFVLEGRELERIHNLISNYSEPYVKYILPLPRGKNETDSDSPIEKLSKAEIELLQEELRRKSENPYYHFILPKANTIKINSIREIKKFVSLEFSDISYRFIIISSAHLMNEAAQNALLKNLEEPPPGVIFILITSYPNRLRETIRSRCWNINFDPLSYEQIANILETDFNIGRVTAEVVAPFSNGSISTALKLIEMDIKLLSEKTISILRYSFGHKFHSAFEEFSILLKDQAAANIQLIIKMIITWLNDLQKHKLKIDHYFFKEYQETLEKFNTKFPDVELNEVVLRLDRLSSYIKNNVNINLLAANVIFELSLLPLKKSS